MDLCFYLGVEVEKEKDIKAKIRTFEGNEIIASLIEASILCEIAPANVTFVLSRKQQFVLLNMGFGKSKGLSRKSQKAKRDQRYLEKKRNFMDLTPSQDESTSQAQPHDPLTHKDTQELLKTPSQDSMEVDDGLAQKMLAALEEFEGKFQNALNFQTLNLFIRV